MDRIRSVSPGEKSGLKSGDIITGVEDQPIERALDFERALLGRKAGEKVVLSVSRGEEELQLPLTIGDAANTGAPLDRASNADAGCRSIQGDGIGTSSGLRSPLLRRGWPA